MKFTERSLRILKFAESEAKKTNKIVYPIHLLLGSLLEKTGVCAELYCNYPNLKEIIDERIQDTHFDMENDGVQFEPFSINVSQTTKQVLEKAHIRMKYFKQIYINEGHIIDAIFKIKDSDISTIADGLDVASILKIMSYPRDMIVSLKDYSSPNIPISSKVTIRKAQQSDAAQLIIFVEKEFGNGWVDYIRNGFNQNEIPIFIAIENQEIVGFSCFDVVRNKKGLFGPMGTLLSKRKQGLGYSLLHYSLVEMKEIGYEYAVIGEVGPIEFYEKACNAVVIPKNFRIH